MPQNAPSSTPASTSAPHLIDIISRTYENWRSDRAIRLGAGLAYYALFAIVPLLAIAVAIAGTLFNEAEIVAFISDSFDNVLSDEMRSAVQDLATSIDRAQTIGSLTIIGVITGVFGASILFLALQDTLSIVWDIPVERGLRYTFRRRTLSVAAVFGAGGLLLAVLLANAILTSLSNVVPFELTALEFLNDIVISAITWAAGVGAVVVLFQALIPVHLPWKSVIVTSAITVLFMVLGTMGVGIYFDLFGSTSLSGVAGSLLIIIFWLYYEAQILVGGAELLKTLTSDDPAAATAD